MQKDTGERDHEGREEIQKKEGRKTTKGGRKCRREGEIRKNGEKVRRRNKGRREDTIKSYSDCLLITPGEDSWGGGGQVVADGGEVVRESSGADLARCGVVVHGCGVCGAVE